MNKIEMTLLFAPCLGVLSMIPTYAAWKNEIIHYDFANQLFLIETGLIFLPWMLLFLFDAGIKAISIAVIAMAGIFAALYGTLWICSLFI